MRHSSHHISTSYVIYNWPRRIPTAYITWSSSRGTDPTRPLQTVRGLSSPTSTEKKKKYTRTNVKPRVSLKVGLPLSVYPARRLSCSGFALRHLFGHSRLSHDRQPKLKKGIETPCSTRHIFSKTSSKRKSGSEIGGATFGSRQPARRRTLTTYFLPQTVYQHQGDVWRTLFYPHGSQYETHQVPQCWPLLNSNMGKRISHQ